MQNRYDELKQQLESGEDPGVALGERLQTLLAQRTEAESALATGRNDHAVIESKIREQHVALSSREQEVAAARDALQEEKMKAQELSVRL